MGCALGMLSRRSRSAGPMSAPELPAAAGDTKTKTAQKWVGGVIHGPSKLGLIYSKSQTKPHKKLENTRSRCSFKALAPSPIIQILNAEREHPEWRESRERDPDGPGPAAHLNVSSWYVRGGPSTAFSRSCPEGVGSETALSSETPRASFSGPYAAAAFNLPCHI